MISQLSKAPTQNVVHFFETLPSRLCLDGRGFLRCKELVRPAPLLLILLSALHQMNFVKTCNCHFETDSYHMAFQLLFAHVSL